MVNSMVEVVCSMEEIDASQGVTGQDNYPGHSQGAGQGAGYRGEEGTEEDNVTSLGIGEGPQQGVHQ